MHMPSNLKSKKLAQKSAGNVILSNLCTVNIKKIFHPKLVYIHEDVDFAA